MRKLILFAFVFTMGCSPKIAGRLSDKSTSGNPVFPGWYADPEAVIFNHQYWIYPTYSAPYDQQVFMDAFSSPDLVHWTKHHKIIDTASVKWVKRAMWAPAILQKDNQYYLFFAANDIHKDSQTGGIGIAQVWMRLHG